MYSAVLIPLPAASSFWYFCLLQLIPGGGAMSGFFKTFANLRRHLRIAGWILLVLLVIESAIIAWKWPFKRQENILRLEHVSGSEVQIGAFQHVFFPSPGYT